MLEEAVEVMRLLWQGGQRSHRGRHYTVENARVYDLPDEPPPVLVSGFGPKAIKLAAKIGDGFVHDLAGQGRDRPLPLRGRQGPGALRHQGLLHGRRARGARHRPAAVAERGRCRASWPRSCPRRRTSSRPCELVTADQHRLTPVGPDLDKHVESLQQYADAGVDELFVQQIGPEQDAFFTTWAREILPRFS